MQNSNLRAAGLRSLRRVYTPLLHCVLMLTWPIPWLHRVLRRKGTSRRVLLVTQNVVALDHMQDIGELLCELDGVSQYATTDWVPARAIDRGRISEVLHVRYIHVLLALFQYWDLIIFTNHSFGVGVWFSPVIKKLYVNHGIHMGKINNDRSEDGVYGRSRVCRHWNVPYYARMFAASEREKHFALEQVPELAGRISVTGYLRADRFLQSLSESRRAFRRSHDILDTDIVVHVISTWGNSSLYARFGTQILEQIRKLKKKYVFVLSLHPRFDELSRGQLSNRDSIFLAWEAAGGRVNRNLDWEDCVAGSDMAVSDHSSLSLYHVLAHHPIVYLDVPAADYVDGSIFSKLKDNFPLMMAPADIEAKLSLAQAGSYDYNAIVEQMLDHRGTAKQRYLEEIRQLLG